MTLLSKVKTVIDYAKYGVSMSHAHNGDSEYELYLPKSLGSYRANKNDGNIINVAYAVKGTIFSFGSSNDNYSMFAIPNYICKEIDLPECTETPGAWGIFSGLKSLITFRMPKLKILKKGFLEDCINLEIVEFGALDSTDFSSFRGCSNIKEFIVGNGTRANLYLYHCPNLSKECLENIIDNLEDRTGLTSLTFYVGEENLAKISEDYKAKLTQKNWVYQ